MRKNKRAVLVAFLIIVLLLSGCDGAIKEKKDTTGLRSGSDASEGFIPDREASKQNRVGWEAYRRMDACGVYHFDPEGKACGYSPGNQGEWVRTDEKTFGEEYPNHHDIWNSGIEASFGPGEEMSVWLTFHVEAGDRSVSRKIRGSMYFADLNGTDGDIDADIIVRNYFDADRSETSYPKIEMSRFGADNDGYDGFTEASDGDLEYYFSARGMFPRFAAEGDKIYAVLDIFDEADEILSRRLWEYTWKLSGSSENDDDEIRKESDPDYTAYEHPGHWNMTDIRFVGGDGAPEEDGDVTITAQRYGVEGETMVYTFNGKDGSLHRIRIPEIYPPSMIYAGDYLFYTGIHIYSFREPEDAGGYVSCSLALGDVSFGEGDYGVKVTPKYYFSNLNDEVKTFKAPPDPETSGSFSRWNEYAQSTDLSLQGVFPAGDKTGDKIYLCYGVMDGFSGKVRMYNIYEYTYTEGPEIEWRYNPAIPD